MNTKTLLFLALLSSPLIYAQTTVPKPMPVGQIETITVGAKRMTVQDILDSLSVHRQPDMNPFMLHTTLSMRLYNDTGNYFFFEKEGYLNRQHSGRYSFNVEKGTELIPQTNQLTPEQESRQNVSFMSLKTQEELVSGRYLKEMLEYGQPAYRVDTAGPDALLHLFFYINKSNWYMNISNRKIKKGDTTEKEIVRFHRLDIDRATWTVRHKEWGVLKVTSETKKIWENAQLYQQYDSLLAKAKQNPATQRVIETLSYAILGDSFLVPVSMTSTDNFSPVAGAPLLGRPVMNPEGSTFELTLSNTTITNKPHNPDYHVMRVVSLAEIFKSPQSKKRK